jgi:hypothetical protein
MLLEEAATVFLVTLRLRINLFFFRPMRDFRPFQIILSSRAGTHFFTCH